MIVNFSAEAVQGASKELILSTSYPSFSTLPPVNLLIAYLPFLEMPILPTQIVPFLSEISGRQSTVFRPPVFHKYQ
jgi:hypothetical protein